jgi:hypothetical protein
MLDQERPWRNVIGPSVDLMLINWAKLTKACLLVYFIVGFRDKKTPFLQIQGR